MFYKIGFYVLLAIVLACGFMFMRTNPMKLQGAMSWAEMYSTDPTATLTFLNQNFGIRVTQSKDMGDGMIYNVIKTPGALWPFAGVMGLPKMADGQPVGPQSMIYLTVTDYDAAHAKMIESGATAHAVGQIAEGMKFGVYTIPGGVTIGIAQYGVKK